MVSISSLMQGIRARSGRWRCSSRAFRALPRTIGISSAGEFVAGQHFAQFQFNQVPAVRGRPSCRPCFRKKTTMLGTSTWWAAARARPRLRHGTVGGCQLTRMAPSTYCAAPVIMFLMCRGGRACPRAHSCRLLSVVLFNMGNVGW